ncbi:MAG TPA: dGTPase [Buttiauxella sp.]|jgi:dGTPase
MKEMKEMKEIITILRQRQSVADHSSLLASTQSDRARLIYSAAFRRLQQKAQVFSLESNSAVRSRLTHSIEVSHIGRYIVAAICKLIEDSANINSAEKEFWRNESLSISNIVETACLMHDIGNPPFGHFGEAAIVEWASSAETLKAVMESLCLKPEDTAVAEELLADFVNFDGNPQGFRILTKLQGEDGYYGLNLTYTQLAVFLKYTCCPAEKNNTKYFNKKIGYFSTEKNILESAWGILNMPCNMRHPLGFLMEASDDISYCISDIEDGIEKKIITPEHFKEFVIGRLNIVANEFPKSRSETQKLLDTISSKDDFSPISSFLLFKTRLSNLLVKHVAEMFVAKYDKFMSFKIESEIIYKGSYEYALLKILKDYTAKYLFTSYEAEKMELSGFAIIKGILDGFNKLLRLEKHEFSCLVLEDIDGIKENKLHIERRLYNRLPSKHLNSYKSAIMRLPLNSPVWSSEKLKHALEETDSQVEWNLRAHLIVDFISGMTDQFSMDTYQLLKGIKV